MLSVFIRFLKQRQAQGQGQGQRKAHCGEERFPEKINILSVRPPHASAIQSPFRLFTRRSPLTTQHSVFIPEVFPSS